MKIKIVWKKKYFSTLKNTKFIDLNISNGLIVKNQKRLVKKWRI